MKIETFGKIVLYDYAQGKLTGLDVINLTTLLEDAGQPEQLLKDEALTLLVQSLYEHN